MIDGVLTDILWTEKYRPTSLADVALEPETRQVLESYIEAGEIPHLLLVGPPGGGKTTIARILIAALDAQVLPLNASVDRSIETVRGKIGRFVTSVLMAKWNVVFLDEADEMTSDAQTGLRNLIEQYAERSRFVLTANKGWKIIAPIQSRCQVFKLGAPPLKERWRILSAVLAAEGIEADPQLILGYAEKYPDMRRMLMAAQTAYLASSNHSDDCAVGHGGGCDCPAPRQLPPATEAVTVGGDELFALLQAKDFVSLRGRSTLSDFDHQQALRDLFWAVPDDHPKAGLLRHVIGRGVHESGYTPDPVVLFLSVCQEAINGL